jgi:hypothetical protein
MSDPHITDADPQHHPNPNYQGIDYFVLDFVKKREAMLDQVRAQQAALPPAVESSAPPMKESEVKAGIAESNARYASAALKREVLNSYYNHPLILHDFATGRGVNLTPGQCRGPALIIGSGPTLDEAHDLIREWEGGLICSTSQGVTMLGLGRKNFHMVAVDVRTESDEFMPLDAWEGRDVTLITHPGMDPEVINQWRWRKQYFRIIVHQMPFYTDIQPIAYNMIGTTMYVYGCAVAAQITIAKMLGYDPLFLVGCDFGYPEEKSRFRAMYRENGEWKLADEPPPMKYLHHGKVMYRNGCPTDTFQAYYKQTFFNVWRLSLADIFRVGTKGGLYEVPSVSIQELAETKGYVKSERYISNKDKTDICERYLLKYGTYTFTYPNGQVEFVLLNNEETDLPRYIEHVNASFRNAQMPGALILSEEKGRLAYLRNDAAWERKEKRWQWEIISQQSPMATEPATSSGNE